MFTRDIKNSHLKKGKLGLLGIALKTIKEVRGITADQEIVDNNGTIGYIIKDKILVAKKAPYGDIVSVDEKIWNKCIKEGKMILMFIYSSNYFYEFNPRDIDDVEYNMRGNSRMVNFDIREGVNHMKKEAQKAKVKKVTFKNQMKFKEFFQEQ